MKIAYALGLLAAVGLYWPRLLRSFWVDETGTYWMVRDGFWAAIEKCASWPGQSIAYGALASLFCKPDAAGNELLLRTPSVIGLALMLYFTTRLATRAMGPVAGCCAFLLLLFHPNSLDLYIQARSYGLAAAAVAASYYFLFVWAEDRKPFSAACWALASICVLHLHYLYATAFLGQAVYLAWVFFVEKRREKWGHWALAVLAVAAALAPLAFHLLSLVSASHTLVTLGKPDIINLALTVIPPWLGPAAAVAALLIRLAYRAWRGEGGVAAPSAYAVLVAGWWLLGTFFMFILSQIGHYQVFVPRYLGFTGPAEALLLSAAAAWLFGRRALLGWAVLTITLVAVVPRSPLDPRIAWRTGYSEAGPALALVRGIQAPVFFQSSLVESNFLAWRNGPSGSYLFNELLAYPVPNRVLPLPIRMDMDVAYHLTGLLDGELKNEPVLIWVRFGDVPEWLPGQMAERGYRMEVLRPNAYSVAVFRR